MKRDPAVPMSPSYPPDHSSILTTAAPETQRSGGRCSDPHGRVLAPCQQLKPGFTLVELIMVLSVLVVLFSLTLPGIQRWQKALPLEQAISTLQLQLQETRLAAIRSGQPWQLILPAAGLPGRRCPANAHLDGARTTTFQLPPGILCQINSPSGPSSASPSSASVSASPSSASAHADSSVRSITFQPDGTVTPRILCLITADRQQAMLRIERLTGLATVESTPGPVSPSRQSQIGRTATRRRAPGGTSGDS
jgi:prepilin-type N-terminal cleavage/methylation domain-containing protein